MRLDAMPDRCPNAVYPATPSVKVTIPGTWKYPVAQIVPSSLVIRRADGTGAALSLANHTFTVSYGDVTRSHYVLNGPCQASGPTGPDSYTDLTMNINTRIARRGLGLYGLPSGSVVTIIVTGKLLTGESFSVTDWLVVQY